MSLIKDLSIKHKLIVIVLLVTVPSIVLGFSVIIVNDVLELKKNLVNDTQLYADLVGEVSLAPLSFGDRSGASIIMEKLRAIPEIEEGYIIIKTKIHTSPILRCPKSSSTDLNRTSCMSPSPSLFKTKSMG